MATVAKSMFTLKVDERRFNKIFGNILKDFRGNQGPIIRKTALDITADIMRPAPFGGWPVATGRSRMGWSGVYKMTGMAPSWEGSDPKAQAEGFAAATAEDKTKKMPGPYVKIINPVRYAAPVNAQHGNIVSKTFRQATKDMKRAEQQHMKRISKENQ